MTADPVKVYHEPGIHVWGAIVQKTVEHHVEYRSRMDSPDYHDVYILVQTCTICGEARRV